MSRPVPVLFVIHSLGHGGSERQVAALSRALDRSRFLPHAASVIGGFRADEMRDDGIPVIELPLRSYLARDTLTVARGLREYIRAHDIGIVHAFDHGPSLFGIAVARSAGVVALSSQRCYMDCVRPKYQALILAAHWLAHGVVVNSQALKPYLRERCKYPLSRIDVCPNGLDASVFYPRPRVRLPAVAGADLVIGSVSVLRKEKNLGLLLEAFARVRTTVAGVKLILIGSGPEEQNLKTQAAHLGLAEACHFMPTTTEVTRALHSIDIFVHPSLTEGMPNAVMEAMACGCTVIASRTGGCPELITHGLHGLLANPGDLADLLVQMRTAIGDPELCRQLAVAAAAHVRSEFSIAASARRLEQIYDRYLARAGSN
jgi:glycosyltransferase involved in cell wall biosynthesis